MLKRWLMGKWVSGILKDAGEGKYGTKVQVVYNWTANHAFWVGALLSAVTWLLANVSNPPCTFCGPNSEAEDWVRKFGEVLVGAGLATQLHASDGPNKNVPGAIDLDKDLNKGLDKKLAEELPMGPKE